MNREINPYTYVKVCFIDEAFTFDILFIMEDRVPPVDFSVLKYPINI